MPENLKFKKSTLSLSIHSLLERVGHKQLCMSVFLGLMAQHGFAENQTQAEMSPIELPAEYQEEIKANANNINSEFKLHSNKQLYAIDEDFDSYQMLQDQMNAPNPIEEFAPIGIDELESLPELSVDDQMVQDIFKVAEQAKQDAEKNRAEQSKDIVVNDATKQDLAEINQAPVNVDALMNSIHADSRIIVEANETGRTLNVLSLSNDEPKEPEKVGFFRKIYNKVRPPQIGNAQAIPRISAEVVVTDNLDTFTASEKASVELLKTNIEAKLSSYTVEAFDDFISSISQLRTMSNQAAQAVGFYNAEFKFEKIGDGKVKVLVVPNKPVVVKTNNVEFSGAGQTQSQFLVIGVLPDLSEGDVFNHGLYEKTKERIADAATNNGYFDSYWRMHDVKVSQPQDTADINLKYETGDRYKIGAVEFRMSDPNKEFPLDRDILEQLVPWEDGQDYAFWRVNTLANNLTNSRYFNYTLVDAVRPDPIENKLEYAPDLQALIDLEKLANGTSTDPIPRPVAEASSTEVKQNVVNEDQFAGLGKDEDSKEFRTLQVQQETKEDETERLKAQARENKKIPVVVTLNADKLNNAEVGLGYGTDTGVRLRSQYRRAIVNKRGHSFDANFELSEKRQSIDGRYNIPYNHPLNDYISLVGGYEREERKDISDTGNLLIESAVLGADRVIKNPRGSWQHVMGVRYRLDRLTGQGIFNVDDIPDTFLGTGNPEQESLLFGYEISRVDSDKRVNPTRGFKQTYKIEVGSENLLTDVNMAIANAGWRFIYSVGESYDHQFVGRADLGYIFTDDFSRVPYNLRYVTGGDQTMRGFDYKSLSPVEDGFKVGGQALAVGSLEYNYQFSEGWRAAVFTDFGNAYDADFKTPAAYSAGVGIRWASPIGPIRLDVASGLSDDSKPIRLHFFIGSQL